MAVIINPFSGEPILLPPSGNFQWKAVVASTAALPLTGNVAGDVRIETTGYTCWVWDGAVPAWAQLAGSPAGNGFGIIQPDSGISITATTLDDTLTVTSPNATISNTGATGKTLKLDVVAVPASALPVPSASTLGGVKSIAAVASKWINTISTAGAPSATQPSFSDISGSISTGQVPTLNQSTTGNAATATSATSATTATNLAGGLGGQVPYQSAAGTTAMLANGTVGQVLTSGGTTAAPTWATPSGGSSITIVPPSYQQFLSAGGTGTYYPTYAFVVTSANATLAATYTNNGQTFTVSQFTIAGQTLLYALGTGAPTASGTLTKSGGTGDSTITFSAYQLPKWFEVTAVGAGGGAGGSGSGSTTAATAGTATTLTLGNSATISAGGGAGAGALSAADGGGGAGGAVSLGTGVTGGVKVVGGQGNCCCYGDSEYITGATGGNSGLGGGGAGSLGTSAGNAGAANTGGGGGAPSNGSSTGFYGGGGGGAGGYIANAVVSSNSAAWATSFAYAIGTGGAGGITTGSGNQPGGAGGSGGLWIKECYQ